MKAIVHKIANIVITTISSTKVKASLFIFCLVIFFSFLGKNYIY